MRSLKRSPALIALYIAAMMFLWLRAHSLARILWDAWVDLWRLMACGRGMQGGGRLALERFIGFFDLGLSGVTSVRMMRCIGCPQDEAGVFWLRERRDGSESVRWVAEMERLRLSSTRGSTIKGGGIEGAGWRVA